ncbi:glucosyltransferase domain-containing protein [Pseudomonas sp. FP2196]|uniref:glucosyltransferase domain-containing protein n=1 Tax=Pseudomonas sp. FP2196 TaxID=2954086 RepID=UPI0027346FFE|nr:glucosyltransferase domain-containing protein [Pseudomonas sp. FP2196]WLH34066.1 glucosyltransferase domain-containing protein [Pseudomonas sp. FP2196]
MHNGFRINIKTLAKWTALVVILTLALSWLLLKSPILTPKLKIETLEFPAEKSQLFYKRLSPYTEQNSSYTKLDGSRTAFQFSLPVYDDDLRWDPLEKAGDFYLTSVSINLLVYRSVIPMENVTPSFQLQKGIRNNRTFFIAPAGSTDPQINIHIDSAHLDKVRVGMAFTLGALIALAIVIWINWHTAILEYLQRESGWIARLKGVLKRDGFSPTEFSALLGVGILLNLIPMSSFFLSVDDEVGAFRTDPSVWISDGRWTAFLVEKFIFPLPVLPFAPNLFFYICLAASYMVILRAHSLKFSWITTLAYCAFVAHPIWWFIGEFYSNLPSTGFGVMCLSIAVYITSRLNLSARINRGQILQFTSAGFFLSLAIGAYQSLAMFYLVVAIGSIIFAARDTADDQPTALLTLVKKLAALAAVFLSGLILYAIFNKVAKYFYPVNYGYLDSFLKIDELLANPLLITKLTVNEMFKIYTGAVQSFGVSFFISAVILGIATILLVTQKTLIASARMLLLIGALLLSPFLLHFVTGGAFLPMRSMLAVSFITWLSVMVILEKRGSLQVLGLILTSVLIFQMVTINSQYAASTILATTHDRLTAEAIYARIAEVDPHFDRESRAPVDVYGKFSFNSRYPSPDSSTMSASFFDWDEGNANRMLKYMQLVGFSNVFALHPKIRTELTPKFKDMPVWPAPGSVRLDNGVYLIKLSEKPDPTHAKYQ